MPNSNDPKKKPAKNQPKFQPGDIGPETVELAHRIAVNQMRRERKSHTLSPTALANEAFVKLGPREGRARSHYLTIIAIAMRQILLDHADGKDALKRGGTNGGIGVGSLREHSDIELIAAKPTNNAEDVHALRSAIALLEPKNPEAFRAFFMRNVQNREWEKIAEVLEISIDTAQRRTLCASEMCRQYLSALSEETTRD